MDDVVHHLVEFALALARSELRHHVLLVLQGPLLHLRLLLLLLYPRAAHIQHLSLLPLHDHTVLDHRHHVLPRQFYPQLTAQHHSLPLLPHLLPPTLTHSLHLVELQDPHLAPRFPSLVAHCCYYTQYRQNYKQVRQGNKISCGTSEGEGVGKGGSLKILFMSFALLLLFELDLRGSAADQILFLYTLQHLQLPQSLLVRLNLLLKLYLGVFFLLWGRIGGIGLFVLWALWLPAVDGVEEKDQEDYNDGPNKEEYQLHKRFSLFLVLFLSGMNSLYRSSQGRVLSIRCVIVFAFLFFHFLLVIHTKVVLLAWASPWRQRPFPILPFTVAPSPLAWLFFLPPLGFSQAGHQGKDEYQYSYFPHPAKLFCYCDNKTMEGQQITKDNTFYCYKKNIALFMAENISHYIFCMDYVEQDRLLRAEFNKLHKKAAYGTAGFRDLSVNMPYIAFRVGVLVAIINKTQPNKHLGVVISASHNKREDNGVKITNFRGNMLEKEYEPKVEEFVNEENLEFAVKSFKEYLVSKGLTVYETAVTVLIGGDTRPSTEPLLKLISDGVQYEQGTALNFHLTTTPQLQYYVYLANVEHKKLINETEQIRPLFYQNFSQYFTQAADFLGWKNTIERTVDCANGVGASAMPHFNALIKNYIQANLINTNDDEFLNEQCGADHVKTKKKFPRKFQKAPYDSYFSFDGDADRIVFYTETDGKLNLIDGDRTGTVLTEFFKRIAKELKEKTDKVNGHDILHLNIPADPTIGFVQTYYANYSSSQYLKKNFGMEPLFAATGVKNLHEKAEHYDIGIYFQGNGHGTVIFNENYLERLQVLLRNKQFILDTPGLSEKKQVLEQLEEYFKYLQFYVNVCKLSNPSVGDAICVFLLFEIALHYLKIDYKDVLNLYTDLESLTSKIGVKAKELLKVNEIEDKVVEPVGLQDHIEQVLAKHKGKKAFLRASGTENVLRLHVEADTADQVQAISAEIRQIVISHTILN